MKKYLVIVENPFGVIEYQTCAHYELPQIIEELDLDNRNLLSTIEIDDRLEIAFRSLIQDREHMQGIINAMTEELEKLGFDPDLE